MNSLQTKIFFHCFLLSFLGAGMDAYAQFDSLGIHTPWYEGSIEFDDNFSAAGLIQFNDKLGTINFKESENSEEYPVTEKRILSMKFFDQEAGRWRRFNTFHIHETESGWQGHLMLEVLIEFENFALLSRLRPVNLAAVNYSDINGIYHSAKVGYEQVETFCLVNEEGQVGVALEIMKLVKDRFSFVRAPRPFLNERLIKDYLGDQWKTFDALVNENKLDLKKRDDFLRSFELLNNVEEMSSSFQKE